MTEPSWTERIDEALRRLDGLTAPEMAARLGLSATTIYQWRKVRAKGAEVKRPRARHREALLRFLDQGGSNQSIPLRAPKHRRGRGEASSGP